MRTFLLTAVAALLLTGCGVGNYSVQSGSEDASFISFTDDMAQDITVTVDNHTYVVKTVKQKAYKSGRNIKQTALNTIRTTPGQHEVKVILNETPVFVKKIFLSTGEHKIIEL